MFSVVVQQAAVRPDSSSTFYNLFIAYTYFIQATVSLMFLSL